MSASIDHCVSFIHSQSRPGTDLERTVHPAVTISRQPGCGAMVVAEKLATLLQLQSPKNAVPWTIFDRDLMAKVLEDHELPAYLAKFLPEDRVTAFEDILTELFGVFPPAHKIVEQTTETMLKLAGLGNVILIGRGGNMVTARVPHVLHVRLVAPLEERIERICRTDHKTPADARKYCQELQEARARYLQKYFHADINDPTCYHLVLNTSLLGYDTTAQIIADALAKLN